MGAKQADGAEFSSYLTKFMIDRPTTGVYEVKAILSTRAEDCANRRYITLAGFKRSSTDTGIRIYLLSEPSHTLPARLPSPFRQTHSGSAV